MSSSDKALANKAKASGMPLSKLKAVYRRGLAAWKTGHNGPALHRISGPWLGFQAL